MTCRALPLVCLAAFGATTATSGDGLPPSAPTRLVFKSPSTTQVDMSWTASTGAQGAGAVAVGGRAGSITSGQTYHLAVMANGGWNVAAQNDSWISKAVGVTYPTLPASVNPGSDSTSSVGTMKIYAYS